MNHYYPILTVITDVWRHYESTWLPSPGMLRISGEKVAKAAGYFHLLKEPIC